MIAPLSTGTTRRRVLVAVAATAALVAAGCSDSGTSGDGTTSTATGTATSAAMASLDPSQATRLDDTITSTMNEASVPGAMVGIWGPDGEYVKAFGVADKSTDAPMETDFYSRIGSMTKTFTVTGVLQLVDAGKVGLDDPISKYVDGVPDGDRITLRELARMQSGLANYTASEEFQQAFFADPRAPFTPQQLLDWAFAMPPSFPPGEGFEYSNTNTTLLGLVVEKVDGRPLDEYVHDEILEPLKMDHTIFPTTADFPDPHAQGYTTQTVDGTETTATDWDPSWAWAAGAMISTLDDMHVWGPALATGTLLSSQTQEQRLQTVGAPGQPADTGYGLGLFTTGGWIGHNGSLPGYQTVTVYLPEQQTTLAIMINTDIAHDGAEPSTLLATAITEIISPDHVYRLGQSAADESETTPAPTPTG